MTKLVIDHFRRWWWLQLFGVLYACGLGWALAMPPGASEYWHGKHLFLLVWLKVQSNLFVSQFLFLALLTGAMLLLYDLQRGLRRTVAVVPMTGRQLGRAWWLATVALPAAAQVIAIFAGAAAFHLVYPGTPFAISPLLLGGAVLFLWLGMSFVIYFVNYAMQNPGAPRGQKLWNFAVNVLIIWLLFGFAMSLEAQKKPSKWAIFFGVGLLLTVFGWWRAGDFRPGPASRFVGRGAGFPRFLMQGVQENPEGFGGIRLLIGATFGRAFLMSLVIAVWMPLVMVWQGRLQSWSSVVESAAGFVAGYWVVSFFCFTNSLRQLRYFRTLPLSAGCLAGTLILAAVLPLLVLGLLLTVVACLSTDSRVTLWVLRNFTLVLCPAFLCLAVAVWRGAGIHAYVVLIATMIAFQCLALSSGRISLGTAALVAAGGLLLAFLLTRHVLRRSSHAYKAPGSPFGEFPLENK